MKETSVFTKRGPDTGARFAFPSSPGAAGTNAHGLNQFLRVCTWAGASQLGLAATGPPLLGSPTWSGRFKLLPFHWKLTPEALALLITNNGKPDVTRSMTSTSQFPRSALTAPFQSAPNCLPFPNGKS